MSTDYIDLGVPAELRDRMRVAKSKRGETYAEFIERVAGDELEDIELPDD